MQAIFQAAANFQFSKDIPESFGGSQTPYYHAFVGMQTNPSLMRGCGTELWQLP
jgi:hypothetical protein